MTEAELPHESIPEYLSALADELEELQGAKNDGRGFSTARGIAHELRRGNLSGAKAICYNEGDKIRNYPDIVDWLQTHVVGEPWLDPKHFLKKVKRIEEEK